MKSKHNFIKWLFAAGTAVLISPVVQAQFIYTNNDLLLGFRKTGIHTESFEAAVNIGQATNYVYLQPGTTLPVPGFTASQLTPDSFSDLNFLSWSVSGFVKTNTLFVLPGYNNNTIWLTIPRSNATTQGTPPARLNYSQQGSVATQIKSIFSGASYLSSQSSAGPENTATFIREPVNNSANVSAFIGSVIDSSGSTLRDSYPQNIETTTPASFSGTSVADFYEIRPTVDPQGKAVTDPHTGQTSGDAYYVGSFTLNSNGTMTFTRGSSGVITNPPPAAPILSVLRTDNATHISLPTDKGAIYTLHFTDAAGLVTPLSFWNAVPGKVTGDGTTKEFIDSTADSIRFYRVSAE